jgi:hypothetical protein
MEMIWSVVRAPVTFLIVAAVASSATAMASPTPSPAATAQAEPAPDATPPQLLAQAEPAPDDYVPPGHSRPDPTTPPRPPNLHPWVLSLEASLVAKLTTVSPALPPIGWGAGITITRALAFFGPMRFGLGAQFGYQRIEHLKIVNMNNADGLAQALNFGEQFLAHTTFAALLVLDGIFGRLRPWFDAGAGFSVAQYYDPATMAGTPSINVTDVVGLITLATGVSVLITRGIEVGLAGHFDFLVSSRNEPAVGTTTPTFSTFSPGLFSARLQVGFRF